jgi:hypothetical protein
MVKVKVRMKVMVMEMVGVFMALSRRCSKV